MESRVSYWAFADECYEELSPAQRHLLLMGKDNADTVQAKLNELKSAFARSGAPPAAVRTADLQATPEAAAAEYGSVTSDP